MVSSGAPTDAYKIIPRYRLPRSPARRNKGALCSIPRPDPTTSHVPDARNAPNVPADNLFGSARRRGVSIQEEQSRMGWSTPADNSEWMMDRDGGERGSAVSSFLRKRKMLQRVVTFPTNFFYERFLLTSLVVDVKE